MALLAQFRKIFRQLCSAGTRPVSHTNKIRFFLFLWNFFYNYRFHYSFAWLNVQRRMSFIGNFLSMHYSNIIQVYTVHYTHNWSLLMKCKTNRTMHIISQSFLPFYGCFLRVSLFFSDLSNFGRAFVELLLVLIWIAEYLSIHETVAIINNNQITKSLTGNPLNNY